MNEQTPINWKNTSASILITVFCLGGYLIYTGTWVDWVPSNEFPDETLPELHRIDFYSHQVDDHYRLHVQLPHGYDDSDDSYGVLYATDGGGGSRFHKQTILPMVRKGHIPQMIYIGIENRTREFYMSVSGSNPTRRRDFAYTSRLNPENEQGNENFHRFIEENIKPFINATYRTKKNEAALGGHSLGGLFTLYSLFRHPESYKYYFASSPSIFFESGRIYEEEQALYTESKQLPAALYMSMGSREAPLMLENFHQLARILKSRNYTGFEFSHEVIANETHGTVLPQATQRGLRFLYQ